MPANPVGRHATHRNHRDHEIDDIVSETSAIVEWLQILIALVAEA